MAVFLAHHDLEVFVIERQIAQCCLPPVAGPRIDIDRHPDLALAAGNSDDADPFAQEGRPGADRREADFLAVRENRAPGQRFGVRAANPEHMTCPVGG